MTETIFFMADTHFGHENIIKYAGRPFQNAAMMDQELIKRWNSVVGKEDIVFLLGDFSFYKKEKTMQICAALNGHKTLIMGNHDEYREEYYRECGFEAASSYPIIYENFWMLSHEPLFINHSMPYANIFGHVHDNPAYTDFSAQSFCVSAERIDYTPISFAEIKKKMGLSN